MKGFTTLLSVICLLHSGPIFAAQSANGERREPHVTPFSQILFSPSPSPRDFPSEGYTRLVISKSDTFPNHGQQRAIDPDPNKWPYDTRAPVSRFFASRTYSTNFTLKASVGRFAATAPLLTLEHDSGRRGEAFSRQVKHQSADFPLFLVGGDPGTDVASFTLSAKLADRIAVSSITTALDVTNHLLRQVAPTSAVLSTLTEDTNRQAADALERAVGQFFSTSIVEDQQIDIDIRAGGMIVLRLRTTPERGNFARDPVTIDDWIVSFEEPRPSIFHDVRICWRTSDGCRTEAEARTEAIDAVEARPDAILAFKLVRLSENLGTISSYLRQQDWWSAILEGNNRPEPARLCRAIRGAVTGIGLSSLDARLVARAVSQSALVSSDVARAMSDNDECKMDG